MDTSIAFADTARETSATIKEYNGLHKKARGDDGLNDAEKERLATLTRDLKSRFELRIVTADPCDADLQEQLVGKDLVHDFGARSVEELKQYRLGGGLDSNKLVFALVNPYEEGGRKILAAIYCYLQRGDDDINDDYHRLAGNVDDILHQPVQSGVTGKIIAGIFFTISSFKNVFASAPMLIEAVHAHLGGILPKNVVLSTLSPERHLAEWMDKHGFARAEIEGDDEVMERVDLEFLLDNCDDVEAFHLSNGAMIGAIKQHANCPGSKDDVHGCGCMANYVYDRDPAVVAKNQILYRLACSYRDAGNTERARGTLLSLMAPHLQEKVFEYGLLTPAGVLHAPAATMEQRLS